MAPGPNLHIISILGAHVLQLVVKIFVAQATIIYRILSIYKELKSN